MSGKTKIEWATKVWNPTVGCTPVTEGCAHCYAKRMYERFYQGKPFSQVQLHPERLIETLRWRTTQRVFVDSMSDLFHAAIPSSFIQDVVQIIKNHSTKRYGVANHVFMVLTKRPKRMREFFQNDMNLLSEKPIPNLWLGVSVSSNDDLWMVKELMETPAVMRFVSVEPMLNEVDLWQFLEIGTVKKLDWVICGTESGPGRRPMVFNWARDLRDQCVESETPFFLKQMEVGGKVVKMPELDGKVWAEFPEVHVV